MRSGFLMVVLLTSIGLPAFAAAQAASKPSQGTKANPKPSLFDKDGQVIGNRRARGIGGKWGGRWRGRIRMAGHPTPKYRVVAQAIEDGLAWLSKHQDADGGWNAAAFMRHDKQGKKSDAPGEFIGRIGITAFCLLAFLGDGQTLASGAHKGSVRRAVLWLRKQQSDSGTYSSKVLEHTLATHAMCEAYSLSEAIVLREEVRSALEHLITLQNDDGGWNHETKGKPSEAFATCHAIFAYRSGLDFRLVGERAPLAKASRWLDKVTKKDGSISAVDCCLLTDGKRQQETSTACGLLARFFLGQQPKQRPEMMAAANLISVHPPMGKGKETDQVFNYVAAYGTYQMGGPIWSRWQRGLTESIATAQRDDGNFKGSWDPVSEGVLRGGRLYATALSVLTLESYYRYTRLVR